MQINNNLCECIIIFLKKYQHRKKLITSSSALKGEIQNPSKGGRYYSCHSKVKNHYIFTKVRLQYCEIDKNQTE